MREKFFLFFSLIVMISCQNNTSERVKTNPAKKHKTVKIILPQKTVEAEINPADKKVYISGVVDTLPQYPDGIQKLYVFIKKNYVLPKEIIKNEAQPSAIFATFIIEKDGTLSDIKIIRDFGYGSGKELVRVLKLSPKWKPAIKEGKAVRCLYSIPYYGLVN